MTGIKGKIQQDMKEALKSKEDLKVSVLRMLLAAITGKEKEKRYKLSRENPGGIEEKELQEKSILDQEEELSVLQSEARKRKEAVLEYEKGGRQELAEKEKMELKILFGLFIMKLENLKVKENTIMDLQKVNGAIFIKMVK